MRISYVHQEHPDWYGAICSCARPDMFWAFTDDDSVAFPSVEEAQKHMKRKKYSLDTKELEIARLLEIFPEGARHVV